MKLSAKDVHYLALEGGGGKGVTYLGAIRALEQIIAGGTLPLIDIERPGKNQLQGISGASAGAITGLLLAMGLRSDAIEALMAKPTTFTDFFDGPFNGEARTVDSKNRSTEILASREEAREQREIFRQAAILPLRLALSGLSEAVERGHLGKKLADQPMVAKLVSEPQKHLAALMFDGGLFAGFRPRDFFRGAIDTFLTKERLARLPGSPDGSSLGFELFYQATGVDFVVTGANISRHMPALFSRHHTPDFPVADAVAISMNLPLVFKPVWVTADVPVDGTRNRTKFDYYGGWVDGGLLNNLPLHAFDRAMRPAVGDGDLIPPLNPHILGLRLTAGGAATEPEEHGPFDRLIRHLGAIMETLMYPSEQGQIRTEAEAAQTIDLLTYDLSTIDFAPTAEKSKQPIMEAEKAVYDYFS